MIQVYNTMEGHKVDFVPRDAGKVAMYVCGPTVYNYIHLGNARPIVVFDTIRRYFKYAGYAVTYVQNFTDVDDKIINRAIEEKSSAAAVAENLPAAVERAYALADRIHFDNAYCRRDIGRRAMKALEEKK